MAKKLRCKLGFHKWEEHLRCDTSWMSISPICGFRKCTFCDRLEQYHYDSQGGWWSLIENKELKL